MSIKIQGKEYVTVAERVKAIHDDLKKEAFSITTEVIPNGGAVVIKATVTTPKGTFTGISAANPLKSIEKMSPYEVAETSAVGRALGFAGYGMVDSIASADEMVKAGAAEKIVGLDEAPKEKVLCKECGENYHDAQWKMCFLCNKRLKEGGV